MPEALAFTPQAPRQDWAPCSASPRGPACCPGAALARWWGGSGPCAPVPPHSGLSSRLDSGWPDTWPPSALSSGLRDIHAHHCSSVQALVASPSPTRASTRPSSLLSVLQLVNWLLTASPSPDLPARPWLGLWIGGWSHPDTPRPALCLSLAHGGCSGNVSCSGPQEHVNISLSPPRRLTQCWAHGGPATRFS